MSELLKIDNVPGWVKNDSNKAILNTDKIALQEYKLKKQKDIQFNSTISDVTELKKDISDIKSEFCELKQLLIQIINSNQNK
jgi:hypothetical protein